jgi:hypothetical protein
MNVAQAKSRLAVQAKRAKRTGDVASDERVADARRELAVAKLEAYIEAVVANAPEFSTEQRTRLQALIATAPASPGRDS